VIVIFKMHRLGSDSCRLESCSVTTVFIRTFIRGMSGLRDLNSTPELRVTIFQCLGVKCEKASFLDLYIPIGTINWTVILHNKVH